MSEIETALAWIDGVIGNYGYAQKRLTVGEAHAIKNAIREKMERLENTEEHKETRMQILQSAVQMRGEVAQTDMCIEEMTELTKALLKVRRLRVADMGGEEHKKRFNNVKEEIADVQIMLDQMRLYYGDTSELEAEKLERLRGRLEAHKTQEDDESKDNRHSCPPSYCGVCVEGDCIHNQREDAEGDGKE